MTDDDLLNDIELDDDDLEELDAIDEALCEDVYPLIDKIDEEHPDHGAWFAVFITTLNELFAQGWTPEELVEDVKSCHEQFLLEAEDVVPPVSEMH
jgi:hypothetical protein